MTKPFWQRYRTRRQPPRTVPLSPHRAPRPRYIPGFGGESGGEVEIVPTPARIPEWGEVIFDGVRFPAERVEQTPLTTFQGKVTFGDHTEDDNPLLSTWVISDLSGGHGIEELNEGTDINRYRFGTLYTRHPKQITLPRKVQEFLHPTSTPGFLLGDLFEGTDFDHFLLEGGNIFTFSEASDGWFLDNAAGATVTPVKPGTQFTGTGAQNKLFVPCGSDGYFTYTGGTYAEFATPTFVDFVHWDHGSPKLVGIDTDGQLRRTSDGTTWTSYGDGGKLDAAFQPKHLVVYRDRSDAPIVHVVTNRTVWAFDVAGPTLYPLSDLFFPNGPEMANGACVWRGALYVSAGMGVFRYNGATVSAIGLDRDDGLPQISRGAIVWLWPETNGLYALVKGVGAGGKMSLSVHVFTGFGWHCEWLLDSGLVDDFGPDWGYVSQDGSTEGYRLWWGCSGDVSRTWSMELPRDFANPRATIADGTSKFVIGEAHYLRTGRFDAQLRGYDKIASTLDLDIGGDMTDCTITVSQRINGAPNWSVIGITTDAQASFQLGIPDQDDIYPGLVFDDIELQFTIEKEASGDETTAPFIRNAVLAFLKILPVSRSWIIEIPLSAPHADQSPEALYTKLESLLGSKVFFPMKHRDGTFRVRIAQLTTNEETGRDERREHVTVNVVEVPQGIGA